MPQEPSSFSVDELFVCALKARRSDILWKFVRELRKRGNRDVLDRSIGLASSPKWEERRLAADVLAQIGSSPRCFRRERVKTLLAMIHLEENAEVINSVLVALGHMRSGEKALSIIRKLKHHRNKDVREGVVFALLESEKEESISILAELSNDRCTDVRSWATFGLGCMVDIDNDGIRNVLAERLNDKEPEIRGEAIVGLARRGDRRAEEAALAEIANSTAGQLVLDATEFIVSDALTKALARWWTVVRRNKEEYDPLFCQELESVVKERGEMEVETKTV